MSHVVSGRFRNLKLLTPKGRGTRPTGARMKEAVFSMLQPQLAGARFLDLYAGSGQMGLEALSRGAAFCLFSEANKGALSLIKKNLQAAEQVVKEGLNAEVTSLFADKVLRQAIERELQFDLIYLDPPWPIFWTEWAKLRPYLDSVLATNGRVLIESEGPLDLDLTGVNLELLRQKSYGRAALTVLIKREEA